jgi:predicted Zn-dependent protease
MKVSRVLGFRSVSVFDCAQTEGKDMAELQSTATTGGEKLLPALERAAQHLEITLVYKAIPGSAKGLSKGGLIEIEETLDTPARCGVIAHELAHEILQHKAKRSETTKRQRELEAEAVAFAVLAHFGMRLESRFYLASYEITGDMLIASIETISRAAHALIQAVAQTEQAPIRE